LFVEVHIQSLFSDKTEQKSVQTVKVNWKLVPRNHFCHILMLLLCTTPPLGGGREVVIALVSINEVTLLELYRSSAPALAEIRPFLQIRLTSGSGQNWAGFEILPDLENFY